MIHHEQNHDMTWQNHDLVKILSSHNNVKQVRIHLKNEQLITSDAAGKLVKYHFESHKRNTKRSTIITVLLRLLLDNSN